MVKGKAGATCECKCHTWFWPVLLLVSGVVSLAMDMGWLSTNVSLATVILLLAGVLSLGKDACGCCQ